MISDRHNSQEVLCVSKRGSNICGHNCGYFPLGPCGSRERPVLLRWGSRRGGVGQAGNGTQDLKAAMLYLSHTEPIQTPPKENRPATDLLHSLPQHRGELSVLLFVTSSLEKNFFPICDLLHILLVYRIWGATLLWF